MTGMIYDSSKIKAYENLKSLCSYAGESEEWCDGIWMEMVQDEELYEEFRYYMNHSAFRDRMRCCGYGLTDLFVWQMSRYHLRHDSGENTQNFHKVGMALRAFKMMAEMKKNPEAYRRRFEEGQGKDQF